MTTCMNTVNNSGCLKPRGEKGEGELREHNTHRVIRTGRTIIIMKEDTGGLSVPPVIIGKFGSIIGNVT